MLLFPSGPVSPFDPPSLLYQLLTQPLSLFLRSLQTLLVSLRGPIYSPPIHAIRLICISDTHSQTIPIPDGDILIHAGDLTNAGTTAEIQAQIDWLVTLPHRHKIAIGGNHDSYLDPRSRSVSDKNKSLEWGDIHYLQHSSIQLRVGKDGRSRVLRFYGAPQIPVCGGKKFAFQYRREDDAWTGTIPTGTDVLVTHTPPKWHLDLPAGLGCGYLLEELWRVRPKVHVFGHVHAARGRENVFWDEGQRAYERLRANEGRSLFWGGAFGIGWSLDVVRLLAYAALGLLWTQIWGAEEDGTLMVNAALTDWKTGTLISEAQIVDL
ncbi:hypothetical protein MMC19_006803 [Ptychographa xylographoides]|nr:hypothetical protein [Ptychographa xylographoides]